MPPQEFDGRVAIVTGASSGIGRATAEMLRSRGALVAAFARSASEADLEMLAIDGDVSDPDAIERLFVETESKLGDCDILVNCAGMIDPKILTEVTPEEWDRMFAVNVRGTYLASRRALPSMIARRAGAIVNVASISGVPGPEKFPGWVSYCASKAAVIGMTEAIGKDVAGTGVLVNCIAPAVIETPILAGLSQGHIDYMVERIPLGRMGGAEEVAVLACWLASEDCSFSTGATYDISGGRAVY